MTKEEIKKRRRELNHSELKERSELLEPFIKNYSTLYLELQSSCGYTGHEYNTVYYNWGSFDERRWTHTPKRCKYCDKFVLFDDNNLTYDDL